MKTFLRAIVALAGLASVAQASDTTIKYEVSTDGLNWSTSKDAQPGSTVQVRARVVWTGATQVFGLTQVTFQPVISGWTSDDSLITNPTTPGGLGVGPVGGARTVPIGTVPDAPGAYGRITPFGAFATNTSTFLRGHLGSGTASGLLRIARADVTNWVGVGPTSGGSAAANNWSGNGGVAVGQIAPAVRIPTDADANLGTDVVVFKFAFTVGAPPGDFVRTMGIGTSLDGIGRETSTLNGLYGHHFAVWFLSSTAIQGTRFYDSVSAESAYVNVVPAPAALISIGLLAGTFTRRARKEI
ncbi:MAG: hypothetical protein WC718_10925 [Phycisphaerales bacterium]|jgi:hypothetical protein